MEFVLLIVVEIPSLRVIMEAKLDEAEWVQSRFDQLSLIDEKCFMTLPWSTIPDMSEGRFRKKGLPSHIPRR